MKAFLRSARIAPKKANLIARLVRGMPVSDARSLLKRTHKKGARMIEKLLASAVANAEHNDKQDAAALIIKTLVVQQGTAYRRGVPMARGRVRPMRKFLSHIALTLGVSSPNLKTSKPQTSKGSEARAPSQEAKTQVKSTRTSPGTSKSSPSSVS